MRRSGCFDFIGRCGVCHGYGAGMKTFGRYYVIALGLLVYFWLILPWMLSQPSDAIVIGGFLSLAVVAFEIIALVVQLIKKLGDF